MALPAKMASAGSNLTISGEEWMISRAKEYMKSDPYAAKAWLITARTMYPKNFKIQFESYKMEKEDRNLREAAKLLQEMFTMFPNENLLWTELRSITECLYAEVTDNKTQFLISLISSVPTEMQCHMLFRMADSAPAVMEQCKLKLVALTRFPHLIHEHGTGLIDALINAEKQMNQASALNCYRKYLVCDVLPLVLNVSVLNVSPKFLAKWLQKSIEFYIGYATQAPGTQESSVVGASGELLSPTKTYSRRPLIQGLSRKESYISNPWVNLYELIGLIGKHLKWDIPSGLSKMNPEPRWQHINQLFRLMGPTPSQQVLYLATVLFLECLYNYSSQVDPEQFTATAGGGINHPPLVLIEALKASSTVTSEPKPKKFRADHHGVPKIHVSKSVSSANDVVSYFHTALKCWELLQSSDSIKKEFGQLIWGWKADSWTWLGTFEIDSFVYQGNFKEAVEKLQQASAHNKMSKLRKSLQLASCHFCLGNLHRARGAILDVMELLPPGDEPQNYQQYSCTVPGGGRQLQLLCCNALEIVPTCIEMMTCCLRERVFRQNKADDLTTGHLITLLQYDWPRHSDVLLQILEKIRASKIFVYPVFFTYIVNIDILEEFSYLRSKEGGDVNLDVLPTSTKLIAQQRTVTRGIEKGAAEDFQQSMAKQIARCDENILSLVLRFLKEEGNSLRHPNEEVKKAEKAEKVEKVETKT